MALVNDTKSLTKKTRKLQLVDQNSAEDGNPSDEESVTGGSFYEHFTPLTKNYFQVCPGKRKSNKVQVTIHSDVFLDQASLLCGFDNDQLLALDISQALSSDVIELPPKSGALLHPGLSCARCSKATPYTFFSSGTEDGKINLWDKRIKSTKPTQSFTATGTGADAAKMKKPIITFDVSPGDQFICAGTELVDEDSFLLFWDLRSTKLMGAYWESHSDDITSIKFHSTKPTSLASGSTDGLLNVFNLLEAKEEDALIYSFNTESSVEKIAWSSSRSMPASDRIACITHSNDLMIWDVGSGDSIAEFDRGAVSKAMKRNNLDDVYLNGFSSNGSFEIFSCSLTGDSCGTLEVTDNGKLSPKALFPSETSVIQTMEFLNKDNRWITFDENGYMKIWSLGSGPDNEQHKLKNLETGKRSLRFKPY